MAYGDGFDISAFKNQINSGILKPTLYQVDFKTARALSDKLSFFTDSVSIPSVDLDTQMIRRYGYGPIEYVPYRPIFGPVSMSFMVEAAQTSVLYDVLNSLSATSAFMGYNNLSNGVTMFGAGTSGRPYEVAYKNDIQFDLQIYVYNETTDKIVTITLKECYVKQIGSINLSWSGTDQYLKVDVTFLCTNYSVLTADAPSNGNALGSSINNPQPTPQSQFVNDAQNISAAYLVQPATAPSITAGNPVSLNSTIVPPSPD